MRVWNDLISGFEIVNLRRGAGDVAVVAAEQQSTVARLKLEGEAAGNEQGLQSMIAAMPEREDAMRQMIESMQKMMEGSRVVGIKRVRDKAGKLVGGVHVRADGTEVPVTIQ